MAVRLRVAQDRVQIHLRGSFFVSGIAVRLGAVVRNEQTAGLPHGRWV
jgi:hypothetical protein